MRTGLGYPAGSPEKIRKTICQKTEILMKKKKIKQIKKVFFFLSYPNDKRGWLQHVVIWNTPLDGEVSRRGVDLEVAVVRTAGCISGWNTHH